MKKVLTIVLAGILSAAAFAGCKGAGAGNNSSSFKSSRDISVVSREDGSGTRGAFIELLGIQASAPDGTKTDMTTKEAIVANKTDVMMTNVAGDAYAIGYTSLGSMNNTVKALKIDGVEATPENIKNGTYKVSRPFNIATKGDPTGVAKDFINYILSADGQAVISQGYIPVNENAAPFTSDKSSGKIVVAGSSSVTPIMEKLVEAYMKVNTGAQVEVQMSDSTSGMTAAMNGTCDIGMASRELKDSEAQVLKSTEIALDGIAIIVNPANPNNELTVAAVKDIYTGKTTTWDEVAK